MLVPSKSKRLLNIIIEPLHDKMSAEDLQKIYAKLVEQININMKYNELCFIVGKVRDITIQNGFWMLEKYGGELLQDIFTRFRYKKIL